MRPNTEVDNSLRDLHNSSHHKKDEFNKIAYSFKILQSSKHAYLQFKKNKPGV